MRRLFFKSYRFIFSVQQWVGKRLTGAGKLVAAGMVITAAFGINTHINLSHQIFTFLVCLTVIGFVASRFFTATVSAERTLPRYASVDQPLTYRIRLRNTSGKVLSDLQIQERIGDVRPSWDAFAADAAGGRSDGWIETMTGFRCWRHLCRRNRQAAVQRLPVGRLGPRDTTDIPMQLTPLRRGRLTLYGPTISRPDPLGLFRSQHPMDLKGSVLVLPRLYRLPPVVLPGKRRFQPGGVAQAASVGDAEEFVALRDYREGDPLRRIHWKSWAKAGKPIVKEYQEEFFVRHALVLDTFQTTAGDRAFEAAVSLAASVVSAQHSETLLDVMFVGLEAYCFTSGRGLAHTDKMLEILAGVDACTRKPFDTLLPLVLQRAGLLSACILVLLDWDDQRRQLVTALRHLHLPVAVFVIASGGRPADRSPGPMNDDPAHFHILETGRIQQELNRL